MKKVVTFALFHGYPLPQVVPGWSSSDPLNRASFTVQERVLNLLNQMIIDIKSGIDSEYILIGGSRPNENGLMESKGTQTLRKQLYELLFINQHFKAQITQGLNENGHKIYDPILTEDEYFQLSKKVLSIKTEDDFRNLKDKGSATTKGNMQMIKAVCDNLDNEINQIRVVTSPEHGFRVKNDLLETLTPSQYNRVVFPEWTNPELRGRTELTVDILVELIGNTLRFLKALPLVDKFISNYRQGGIK